MASAVGENTTSINGLKQNGDMQMMYCNVCKIFLNSSTQADAHFAGKSHKNKSNKSLTSEVGQTCLPINSDSSLLVSGHCYSFSVLENNNKC